MFSQNVSIYLDRVQGVAEHQVSLYKKKYMD